jgi:hypothetical protein
MAGVLGLQNGELQVGEVGDLKTKDAGRCRIEWHLQIANRVRMLRHSRTVRSAA